jgi:glutaminase
MNYQNVIEEIFEEVKPLLGQGKVADYIPALAKANPNDFGIAVIDLDGNIYRTGNTTQRFSIQSISKVFTFAVAFSHLGDDIWQRVGREPSGNPFNSLVQLEKENGIPRNPFINAGALVITDMLFDTLIEPRTDILQFVNKLAGQKNIEYDIEVANSERENGYRNAALANFLRSHNNIKYGIEEVLNLYFCHCSITMSAEELAKSFLFLANRGVNPDNGERVLTMSQTKRLNALMMTCGAYDEAGDFAFRVGMPGKSGVGGGIAAVIPGELAIAVWSPALNAKGNSLAGVQALELFTTKTGKSVF